MALSFELLPLRFFFRATAAVKFPPGKAGNVFRGGFGTTFRQLACVPECTDVPSCPRRSECAYARLFEPTFDEHPSGFATPPRPFVLRAAHLDGRTIQPGTAFHLDVHVFETRFPAAPWFERVFRELAAAGIGPGRGRASVERSTILAQTPGPLVLDLASASGPVSGITVAFLTPTELKGAGELQNEPNFATLFGRIRDRISSLRAFYGPGPPDVDFAALGAAAAEVRLVRSEIRHLAAERFSTRTGQVHPLGGFTGEAEYEGDLTPFIPWLTAAWWTGVGRQTVWGKGAVRVIACNRGPKSQKS